MTRVQCIECGNVQDAFGRWFYVCNKCGKKQAIENSVYEVQSKKIDSQSSPMPSQTGEIVDVGSKSESEGKTVLPAHSENSSDLQLEIQDNEPEQVPIKYNCPFCKSPVERFGDCTNPECLAEISWKE